MSDRIAKMRATIRARQAAGLHFGRPRQFPPTTKPCDHCGAGILVSSSPKARHPRYCDAACRRAGGMRRKLPYNAPLFHRLYWTDELSTEEIAEIFGVNHRSVVERMKQLGVPRRPVGHSRRSRCRETGCTAPVFRIRHTNNGAHYGSRCEAHWIAHRNRLADTYAARSLPKDYQPGAVNLKRIRRLLRTSIPDHSQHARGERG